jgi:hypothetical protein
MLGAANFATLAMNVLAAGKVGRLASYRRGENYVDMPLEVVARSEVEPPVASLYDATIYRPAPGILWAARF